MGLKLDTHQQCKLAFIHWEEVMTGAHSSSPMCDAIYHDSDNNAYFIEFKNIDWFIDTITDEFKDVQVIGDELCKKFQGSFNRFKKDGNSILAHYFIFAFDVNVCHEGNTNKPREDLLRHINIRYVSYLDSISIIAADCGTCFYIIP
ncbi:MAG: hypothetical protein LBD50_00605 [Rickettsiales bacterium]|nr:hypothetical protein [Rickettsiales bacterium]